jgi:hypothetical protein
MKPIELLQLDQDLFSLLQEEGEKLTHCKSSLSFKRSFLILPIMIPIEHQDFMVRYLFDFDIEH